MWLTNEMLDISSSHLSQASHSSASSVLEEKIQNSAIVELTDNSTFEAHMGIKLKLF